MITSIGIVDKQARRRFVIDCKTSSKGMQWSYMVPQDHKWAETELVGRRLAAQGGSAAGKMLTLLGDASCIQEDRACIAVAHRQAEPTGCIELIDGQGNLDVCNGVDPAHHTGHLMQLAILCSCGVPLGLLRSALHLL